METLQHPLFPNLIDECTIYIGNFMIAEYDKNYWKWLKIYNNLTDQDPESIAASVIKRNYKIYRHNKRVRVLTQTMELIRYHPTFSENPECKLLGKKAREIMNEMGFGD